MFDDWIPDRDDPVSTVDALRGLAAAARAVTDPGSVNFGRFIVTCHTDNAPWPLADAGDAVRRADELRVHTFLRGSTDPDTCLAVTCDGRTRTFDVDPVPA